MMLQRKQTKGGTESPLIYLSLASICAIYYFVEDVLLLSQFVVSLYEGASIKYRAEKKFLYVVARMLQAS